MTPTAAEVLPDGVEITVRETLEDLFMRAVTDPETGQVLAPGARANGNSGKGGRR